MDKLSVGVLKKIERSTEPITTPINVQILGCEDYSSPSLGPTLQFYLWDGETSDSFVLVSPDLVKLLSQYNGMLIFSVWQIISFVMIEVNVKPIRRIAMMIDDIKLLYDGGVIQRVLKDGHVTHNLNIIEDYDRWEEDEKLREKRFRINARNKAIIDLDTLIMACRLSDYPIIDDVIQDFVSLLNNQQKDIMTNFQKSFVHSKKKHGLENILSAAVNNLTIEKDTNMTDISNNENSENKKRKESEIDEATLIAEIDELIKITENDEIINISDSDDSSVRMELNEYSSQYVEASKIINELRIPTYPEVVQID